MFVAVMTTFLRTVLRQTPLGCIIPAEVWAIPAGGFFTFHAGPPLKEGDCITYAYFFHVAAALSVCRMSWVVVRWTLSQALYGLHRQGDPLRIARTAVSMAENCPKLGHPYA
jgi:hypothetical protein